MCTNEQLRAAYALNLCTVSVAQIIDYNDIGILMQEYDNILNNLNMEAIPKNNALREALVQILDTIKLCKISEGDRKLIDSEYQNRMKNAVWSAVPHLGLIFATGNPIAIAMNLATQVGIGYMNYRRNRAEYQQGQEKEYWQIQKSKLDMFSNLQQMLRAVAKSYPDCLIYVAKGGTIKEVEYQSGNIREIAEGAVYTSVFEKKHFLKKEIERFTANEDFLRVGQYVYFYQGGNNGATSGPLMKASLSNPSGVQVVRLYDSLEEAGLA